MDECRVSVKKSTTSSTRVSSRTTSITATDGISTRTAITTLETGSMVNGQAGVSLLTNLARSTRACGSTASSLAADCSALRQTITEWRFLIFDQVQVNSH